MLRYVGKVALLVKGGGSGRAYALRRAYGPARRITKEDVNTFLASPLFVIPKEAL